METQNSSTPSPINSEQRKKTLEICCSAPGKVLITGGYLVLERPNKGLVLSVDARFYTSIKPIQEYFDGILCDCFNFEGKIDPWIFC